VPPKSKKQKKFMQAVAKNKKFAKKVGVPQTKKEKSMKHKKMMGGGMADRRGRAMTRMGADAAGRAMMMKGGKVKKMRAGGNTSRMNDLEELGRIDARKNPNQNDMAEKRRVVREIENKKAGGKVKGYKDGGMADKEGRAMAKNKRGMSAAKMADARGRAMKSGGATMKAKGKGTQGYNARLDESLGMRKGKASTKSQSYKARRDESKGMEKSAGKKAYSGNRKSAQGSASKRADGIAQRGRTKGRMV
jgi:hypothetical protein